jgi:hypothetical protein
LIEEFPRAKAVPDLRPIHYSVYGIGLRSIPPLFELAEDDSFESFAISVDLRLATTDIALRTNSNYRSGRNLRSAESRIRDFSAAPQNDNAGNRNSGVERWLFRATLPDGRLWARYGKIEGGYLLNYIDLADFIVDQHGREIRCVRIEPGVSEETARHLLLDQVLPLVLNLLGRDVLHATAVLTPFGVCAFIGPAGAGKSTLAASFAASGYLPFCDDCMVVQLRDEILAYPGYPGLRLWDDSADALTDSSSERDPVAHYTSKSRLFGEREYHPRKPHPLIAIYRVERRAEGALPLKEPYIEPLEGRAAFMELVAANFVLDITDRATLARHFRFVQQLIARVPIRRIRLPNDFAALPSARKAILENVGQAAREAL